MRNPAWSRDEVILALALYFESGRRQLDASHERVLELSALLKRLPIHPAAVRDATFRNVNSVAMKIGNFVSLDPAAPGRGLASASELDEHVWDEFSHDATGLEQLASAIRAAADLPVEKDWEEDSQEEFPEGQLLSRLHKSRERNRLAVARKKRSVLRRTGRLKCQCCGFDFLEVFGALGEGFAECHHTLPLAQLVGIRGTRLGDLAIVCANCHRMLHHRGGARTVSELAKLVLLQRGVAQ